MIARGRRRPVNCSCFFSCASIGQFLLFPDVRADRRCRVRATSSQTSDRQLISPSGDPYECLRLSFLTLDNSFSLRYRRHHRDGYGCAWRSLPKVQWMQGSMVFRAVRHRGRSRFRRSAFRYHPVRGQCPDLVKRIHSVTHGTSRSAAVSTGSHPGSA